MYVYDKYWKNIWDALEGNNPKYYNATVFRLGKFFINEFKDERKKD